MRPRTIALIRGAVLGGVLGYAAGVKVGCTWLWPESNLCGLAAVFVTMPVGVVIGIAVAWRWGRR